MTPVRLPASLQSAAFSALPSGLVILSRDGVITWANDLSAKLLEVPDADALLGRHLADFLPAAEQIAVRSCLERLAESPTSLVCKIGDQQRISVRMAAFEADGARHVLVVICEMERSRPVQAELRHAQKLEVVGQLAGGIAHDFNNLITAIFGYLDIARRMLPADHQAQAAIDGVREAAEQAAGVTRTLLTFTRKSTPERARVNLKELVQQSVKLLRKAMPSSIQLITPPENSSSDVWLEADANQIQQVILNLALNARDALSQGGTIRISAEYAESADGAGPPRAVLVVSDTGGGIPPEVLPRIFDPFFTTKSDSGHSGLGLAIIQDIIRSHQGRIELKTAVGEGTTFRVSFPAAALQEPPPKKQGLESSPAHGETLLIVEDDALVRQIIASQLRQFGYTVIEAGTAQSAAALAHENRDQVALVICDLELPDMPGDRLAARLRSQGNLVPVVLITGSILFDPGMLEGDGVTILRKPFGVARLADTVAKILSTRSGSLPDRAGELQT